MDDDDFESMDDYSEKAAETFLSFFGSLPKPKNRRFRLIDGVVLGALAAHNVSEAITNTLAATYNQLASHANYGRDVEDMREEAAREIETLISGEDQ